MGSKGSQGTTTSTTTPAGPAMQSYRALMQRANQYSQTPYQAYGGELVAGVNPEEMQGIGGINQYANYAQPLMTEAEGLARSAATPLTSADIQQYMDPYTGQVISATEADFANTNAQQMQGVKGNAIAQGALGGNREAVAEAETAAQQQRAEAPILANLRNQGYQIALNTAMQEKAAQGQGAYSLGNLGVSGQNAGLTGANAMIGAGGLEQSTQQALDQALYGQFMQKMGYTPQMLSWLAGITTGVGSQMGGTSSTTGPPPNPWAQIAGLGALGLGAIGGGKARGGVVNREVGGGVDSLLDMARKVSLVTQALQGAHRGGGIAPRGYAEGGAPWDASEWIPDEQMTKGSGAPKPPAAPGQTGAGGGGLSGLMGLGQAAGNVLGSVGGSVATGLGEVMPESMASVAEFLPFLALHRGGVAGYDDGGGVANRFEGSMPWGGAKSWIPGMQITKGGGPPKPPSAPKDTNPLSDMKTMSGLGKGVSGAYDSFQKSQDARDDAEEDAKDEARGGLVRGYDDGGDVSPTDPEYKGVFADTPVADDFAAFGAPGDMSKRQALLDAYREREKGNPDIYRGDTSDASQLMPVTPRPQGIAPPNSPWREAGLHVDTDTPSSLSAYADDDRTPSGRRRDVVAPPPPEEHRGFGLGLFSPNVSNALMTAGLGMMASRSPYFLSGVGEGGLAGMQAYTSGEHLAKQEKMKQEEIDQRAKKLSADLDFRERPYHEMTAAQKAEVDLKRVAEANRLKLLEQGRVPPGYRMNPDGTMSFIPQGPHDPAVIKAQEEAKVAGKSGPGMTPESKEIMARQMISGNYTGYNSLGRTGQGLAVRNELNNMAAELVMKEKGLDAAHASDYMNQQKQAFGARQIGLNTEARTAGNRETNLDLILRAAHAAIPAALEASEKVERYAGRWVPINQIIQKGEVMTSNPELAEFGMANLQLAEHWARAMNPTGVMRESDRDKALGFLNTATSKETYARMVAQLEKQITRERDSIHGVAPGTPINPNAPTPEPGVIAPRPEIVAGVPAAPTAPTRPTPAPKIVNQGGKRFEVQPDGNYKYLGPVQ